MKKLLALGLAVLFALATLEVALRVGLPAQTRHFVWPPGTRRIAWPDPRFVPGVEREVHFDVNREGVRGPEMGPDTDYRVLVMGGSATECLYLDTPWAWPDLVGRALSRTRDGRVVWTANAGKSGLLSRDHVPQLKYLAQEMPRLDRVMVMAGVNDLAVALAAGDHYQLPAPVTDPDAEQQLMHRAFSIAPGQDINTDDLGVDRAAWYGRTALYQLARSVRQVLASRIGMRELQQDVNGEMYSTWRDHRRHAVTMINRAPDLTQPLVEYRRNLDLLAEIAATRHIRLVLMTQPTLWRSDLPRAAADSLWLGGVGDFQSEAGHAYYTVPVLADTMRRFNDVLMSVCQARGLDCLDLAAQIPAEAALFYDDCHFTEAGSQAVAAVVSAYLKSLPPF